MKCDGCPIRGMCGGDLLTFAKDLAMEHGVLLAILAAMAEVSDASVFDNTVVAFMAGYVAAAMGSEPVDMDIWGECFDADNPT